MPRTGTLTLQVGSRWRQYLLLKTLSPRYFRHARSSGCAAREAKWRTTSIESSSASPPQHRRSTGSTIPTVVIALSISNALNWVNEQMNMCWNNCYNASLQLSINTTQHPALINSLGLRFAISLQKCGSTRGFGYGTPPENSGYFAFKGGCRSLTRTTSDIENLPSGVVWLQSMRLHS